jgi:SAM-dependent methyltransferase
LTAFADLRSRLCPVCFAPPTNAEEYLAESIDVSRMTASSFASRKEPEYMSYRLVRCRTCQTVYAAEAPPAELLVTAYREADYDSAEEARLAAATYRRALQSEFARVRRGTLLEIGTGTGAFLQEVAGDGFEELIGIEPSQAAIQAANPAIRASIREGAFDPSVFAPGSLSVMCCFQTLEHISEPRSMVQAAQRLLEPGGLLAIVAHDVTAPLNRILGRRSPIIDIEHLQLFSPASLRYLLEASGFDVLRISSITNTYPLRYWLRLAPLPMKRQILRLMDMSGFGGLNLSVKVGNLLALGRPR